MRKLLAALLALALTLSLGTVAFAGEGIFDSLYTGDTAYESKTDFYPVVDGLLVYASASFGDTINHLAFSGDTWTVDVTLEDPYFYLGLVFPQEMNDLDYEWTRISGDSFYFDYEGCYKYATEPGGQNNLFSYEYYIEPPFFMTKSVYTGRFSTQLDGKTYYLDLTIRVVVPDDAADFDHLVAGEQMTKDGYLYYDGVAFIDEYSGAPVTRTESGWVNGYRAYAVRNNSEDQTEIDFSMLFDQSQEDREIYYMEVYDSQGNQLDDCHEPGLYQVEYGDGQTGYFSEFCSLLSYEPRLGEDLLVVVGYPGQSCAFLFTQQDKGSQERLALPQWHEAWNEVLNISRPVEDSEGDKNTLWTRYAQELDSFWSQVRADILSSQPGETLKVDAGAYEYIPHSVVDAMAGRELTFELSWKADGETQTASIDCTKVTQTPANRIYYLMEDFAALYQ